MTGKTAHMSNYAGGFNGGLTVRGVPLSVAHPGKVFFVGDSSTAAFPNRKTPSDGNKGTFMDPFATIDYAVGQCTANRGDIIYVLPGHTETIDAASALDLDVAGVAVVGLGSGGDRPVLSYTDTAGTVDIAAANVFLHNLIFRADVSAVVVGVNVDANYATIDSCRFDFNETGDDFVTMVDIDAVDYAVISNCEMKAEEGTAGCNEAIRLDDADGVRIVHNHITGDFTDGAIIGEGAVGTDLVIAYNTVYNADTTAGFVLDLNVAFTGIHAYNSYGTLFATAPETALDPGSLLSVENYVCNAVDESGALVPTVVST